jgi:hypothetical protein
MSTSSTVADRVVWQDDINRLFAAPYWIPADKRQGVAKIWHGCMGGDGTDKNPGFGIDLWDCESVKKWAVLIYHYLHSHEMPLTTDPQEYWPDEALERLRAWINDGMPRTLPDPRVHREILRRPVERPLPRRIRKDIRSLTQAELDDYRARLDDIRRWTIPIRVRRDSSLVPCMATGVCIIRRLFCFGTAHISCVSNR